MRIEERIAQRKAENAARKAAREDARLAAMKAEVAETHVKVEVTEALERNKYAFRSGNHLSSKDRQAVLNRLNSLQCDPIAVLAALAAGIDPSTGLPPADNVKVLRKTVGGVSIEKTTTQPSLTLELRAFCAKELAQYVHPKLKAVEHSVEGESGKNIVIVLGSVMDRKSKDLVAGARARQLEASATDCESGA